MKKAILSLALLASLHNIFLICLYRFYADGERRHAAHHTQHGVWTRLKTQTCAPPLVKRPFATNYAQQ